MGKGVMRCMAVWMSMLIILLPLYVSSAFAIDQSSVINIVSVKGADGIKNIRRGSSDYTKIDAEVFSSTPLTAQNVQLKSTAAGAAMATFQTCTDLSPYLCTWQSQTNNLPAGAYSYFACIGGCANCFQTSCKKTATIYVDGVAPNVDQLSADKAMTNGGKIKLHYRISDRACLSAVCSGKCSGITRAELYDVGADGSKTIVGTININSEACTAEDDYNFSSTSMQNGERKLCMIAYDRFMQNSTINMGTGCIAIKKDNTMPSFTAVRLMDPKEGYDLRYVSGAGTSAKLVVNLTASTMFRLLEGSITADLVSIGGVKNDKISCNNLGNGVWSCSKSFNAAASGSGSASIQLSAVDEGGNNNTQTFTFSLTADTTSPAVDEITSGHYINKVSYLKGGVEQVFAVITEGGSGLGGNNVFFGVGESNRAYCGVLSGKWVCYANMTISGGTALISVHGQDDAGNMFSAARSIMVDSTSPVIENKVVLRNTNNNPFFVTNDDVMVTITVTDNRGIIDDAKEYWVYMIPEGFADPNPVKAESCTQDDSGGNRWTCQWTIMNVAPGKMKINFNVSDVVGNNIEDDFVRFYIEYLEPTTGNYTLIPQTAAEVYDVEGQAANYWEATAGTSMPETVDSATSELIEHSVWIPVTLTPRSSASLFSVELAGCTGSDYSNYAKESALIRSSPRSDTPYVRITLKRGAIETTEMNFECSLNIVSKHNKKISQMEVVGFNATVSVVSHGELSNEVLEEIIRTSQGWLVKASWMESLGKVINLFTRICGLLSAIGRALRDIIGIKAIGVAFCEKFIFCNPAAQAGKVSVKGLAKGQSSIFNALYKFCQYVSCSKTLWGSYLMGNPDFDATKFDKLKKEGKIDQSQLDDAENKAFDNLKKKCDAGDQAACTEGKTFNEKKDEYAKQEYIRQKQLGWSGRMEQAVNSHLKAKGAPVSDEEYGNRMTDADKLEEKVREIKAKLDECLKQKEDIERQITENPGDAGLLRQRRDCISWQTEYDAALAEWRNARSKLEEARKSRGGAKAYIFGTDTETIKNMPEAERKKMGLQSSGFVGSLTAWGNPQNSLILSLATGCLPGIFMNLQKARQIECQYLSCLINDLPGGMPIAACTKVRGFQWCMFVFGEIFQIIPFAGSIKNILSPVLSMLKNPLTLIFGIIGAVCDFMPKATDSTMCHFLNSVNSVINIINTIKEIASAKDLFNLKGTDSCKETLTKAQQITQKAAGGGVVGAISGGAVGGATAGGTGTEPTASLRGSPA